MYALVLFLELVIAVAMVVFVLGAVWYLFK